MTDYRATYIISSRRNRTDERDVTFHTNMILNVGDTIELDGITWDVNEIVRDKDRLTLFEDANADALDCILVDELGYTCRQSEKIILQMKADDVELVTENLWKYLTRD